jgi:hypothetical protein
MNPLLDMLENGDFCSVAILIGILYVIGSAMSNGSPTIQSWSWRLAGAAWLIYTVYAGAEADDAQGWIQACLRGLLAGGLMLGIASIALSTLSFLWSLVPAARVRVRPVTPDRKQQREALERERRDEEERRRIASIQEQQRRLTEERVEQTERERNQQCREARAKVVEYYDEHQALLVDTLPRALFESQLHTRFPEGITPAQAFKAAEEMLAAILPLVTQGRDRQRTEQEQQQQRQQRVRRIRREISHLEQQLKRLESSPINDPEFIVTERRALQEHIRELNEEQEALESAAPNHEGAS